MHLGRLLCLACATTIVAACSDGPAPGLPDYYADGPVAGARGAEAPEGLHGAATNRHEPQAFRRQAREPRPLPGVTPVQQADVPDDARDARPDNAVTDTSPALTPRTVSVSPPPDA